MNSDMASRGWDIRPLTEEDIEAYLDIYLNSYPAYKALDAECRAHYRAKHLTELREDTQTRTVGLFEDGTLIATMKLILFSMNFFGRMQPACGLMALEVHPLHKKKGAALAMVRYFEDYARQNGALLTLLLNVVGVFDQVTQIVSSTGLDAGGFDLANVLSLSTVLSAVTIFSIIEVVLFTVLVVILTLLYNVVSTLVGGIHVTLGDD